MTSSQPESMKATAPLETEAPPAKVSLRQVTKSFRSKTGLLEVLQPTNLEIREGEFLILVGPSGCGKTTLLNLVAGFEFPTHGQVLANEKPVSGPGTDRMVMFQDHALFPWLNVIENVMFGLKAKKRLTKPERREIARHYLNLVNLGKFENSFIHELSGGMKQRVALARVLAPNPRILLMDEPFGALDALSREQLYQWVQKIFAKTRKTVIFVTHNVREAACLGDRVLIFSSRPGRIKKEILLSFPRPRQFYDPDVSRYAALILDELKTELNNEDDPHEAKSDRAAVLPIPDYYLADGI